MVDIPKSISQSTSQSASQPTFQPTSTIDSQTSSQSIQEKKHKKKRIQLLSKDVDSARERLLALPQVEEHGEYTGSSEIILKENVSLEEYLDYRDKNPNLSVRVYLHDGRIKAYEVPLTPHAMVSAVIKILMGRWNYHDLEYGDGSNMIVGQNSAKEPDSWIRPVKRRRSMPYKAMDRFGGAYPTMIVEVGYTQSLPDLHQKVALYFSQATSIQIVLTIKIFDLRADNTLALIAMLYLRTDQNPLIPVKVISFGKADPVQSTVNYIINTMNVPPNNFIGVGRTVNDVNCLPCDRAGIPIYQMNIPAAELFDGDPNGVPMAAAGGFNLDLWEVQVKSLKGFNFVV
ncbi:19385_t:CDS:2 [Funneliformis geosporum]|uniref:19385_t:CDS:1 n=1 Tax=Funneliformis geosporum TaxID=1117311 RepID=A0A9W4WPX8_9GLOM|nr:19385_t:CDS:2 [Funneliformis geosporum]